MSGQRSCIRSVLALVIGLTMSSHALADSASTKIVILRCLSNPTITVIACDRSAGVATACPALNTSCAQAVALFESAPDNLKIVSVTPSVVSGTWYTLGEGGEVREGQSPSEKP